ncbi:HEPN domain-containing protein [Streptomyces niveus]|uniref:HEPN domain-containing protein n=1 Tax=Streptomyces niveus TaxID=193462 RepID=UPI0033C73DB5
MASITRRLKRLKTRERILRKNLLGSSNTWGTPPSDEEYDKALAYRVLMHAEIERHFEDTVLSALLSSHEIFKSKNGTITYPAGSALSHYRSKCFIEGQVAAETTFADQRVIAHYATLKLDEAVKWVESTIVTKNHGIKPQDIRRLMGWIGVDSSEINANLLDALKLLGNERGDAAHLSRREIWRRYKRKASPAGASKIKRLPSPSDEVAAVDAVLKLLPELDRLIQTRLRSTI